MSSLAINNTRHHYLMEPTNLRNIYKQLETPCFVFDEEELRRSVVGFQTALEKHFHAPVVGYSVKTNSTPYCMQKAMEMGAWAEVVSSDEYELALKCGCKKGKIIYNGPMKSKETFIDAVEHGAIVNIETKRELVWLKELDKDCDARVGLRLNTNISHVSLSDADGDDDNSRFGFSDETNELNDAINYIASLPNVSLTGLHIHRTAHSRSVRFYRQLISHACDVIRKYGLTLDYLDVGGGYFGIFPNKPTYQDYSDAFHEVLEAHGLDQLRLIVEPGNALVASCFTFISEVIDHKQVEPGLWFITTDGSRNDIDPFFKKSGYLDEEMYQHDTPTVREQVVTGCTCLEYDRMFSLSGKPLLDIGDRIVYHNVGAYTMCLPPMFIRYLPNIYAQKQGHCELVRGRWTASEFLQKSVVKH